MGIQPDGQLGKRLLAYCADCRKAGCGVPNVLMGYVGTADQLSSCLRDVLTIIRLDGQLQRMDYSAANVVALRAVMDLCASSASFSFVLKRRTGT